MTAVLLALAGALAFAVATVVQHRAAAEAGGGCGLRLLGRLLRRRSWLAAQAAGGLGVALHAAALRSGSVVLVQPLLSSGLVFSLGLGALVDRRHRGRPLPGRAQGIAAGAVAAGLAGFLLTARPAHGVAVAPLGGLAGCAATSLAVDGAAVLWAGSPRRPHRALVLGAAAGTGFGVSGLLLKQVLAVPLLSWPGVAAVLVLVLVAMPAVLLAQQAYQAGPLIESLPVATVLEPTLAVLLAGPLFGEHLAPGSSWLAGQLAGALVLAGGLVVVARGQPHPSEGGDTESSRPLSAHRPNLEPMSTSRKRAT